MIIVPQRQNTTLHYTTLHYTTLHYTTLHYTTLHYTTLRFTTLHYTTLHHTHYATPHYTNTTLQPANPQPEETILLAEVLQSVFVQINNTALVVHPRAPVSAVIMLNHFLRAASEFRSGFTTMMDEKPAFKVSLSTAEVDNSAIVCFLLLYFFSLYHIVFPIRNPMKYPGYLMPNFEWGKSK
jgi:hypothetical protein